MALLSQYIQVYGQLPLLFEKLREGRAPDKFTREFLKDIGFKSSNHHGFIPLLKGMGFLTSDGTPTQRYKDFLDPTRWKKILAEAVREAYGDIFVLKTKPTKSDKDMIAGKYKSTYNMSEKTADMAARTFLALLELADPETLYGEVKPAKKVAPDGDEDAGDDHDDEAALTKTGKKKTKVDPKEAEGLGLHYNIQIHLPATKDIEVYNAIFKSLKAHLID